MVPASSTLTPTDLRSNVVANLVANPSQTKGLEGVMITIKAVQGLGPGETVWDTNVKGFGVRKQLKRPVYVLKYRHAGKQRFVTIGPHGSPWTPETARREAKRLLGAVAGGRDPRAPTPKLPCPR
jgi:hypothetical protein